MYIQYTTLPYIPSQCTRTLPYIPSICTTILLCIISRTLPYIFSTSIRTLAYLPSTIYPLQNNLQHYLTYILYPLHHYLIQVLNTLPYPLQHYHVLYIIPSISTSTLPLIQHYLLCFTFHIHYNTTLYISYTHCKTTLQCLHTLLIHYFTALYTLYVLTILHSLLCSTFHIPPLLYILSIFNTTLRYIPSIFIKTLSSKIHVLCCWLRAPYSLQTFQGGS